jgi:hypothetical protein
VELHLESHFYWATLTGLLSAGYPMSYAVQVCMDGHRVGSLSVYNVQAHDNGLKVCIVFSTLTTCSSPSHVALQEPLIKHAFALKPAPSYRYVSNYAVVYVVCTRGLF